MIGETMGNFELRSRLGHGPFGEVWLAGHRRTRDAVVIIAEPVAEARCQWA